MSIPDNLVPSGIFKITMWGNNAFNLSEEEEHQKRAAAAAAAAAQMAHIA